MQPLLDHLIDFFADKEAFTLGGTARILTQLLTMMGAAIALRLVMKAPDVVVSAVEPLGLFDVNQYEESFGLRGIPLTEGVRKAVRRLTGLPDEAPPGSNEQPIHWILTWDASTTTSARRAPLTFKWDGQVMTFPVTPDERVAYAKHMLSTAPSKNLSGFPNSPRNMLIPGSAGDLSDFTLFVMPTDARSRYTDKRNWEGQSQLRVITGQDVVTNTIEASETDPMVCALALEQVYGARWFVNMVEVENKSGHASASAVRVAIDHSGLGEAFLLPGGNLELAAIGQYYSTTVHTLLPGERRWAVLRTRRPIDASQLSVLVDPTPFFYPAYATPVLVLMGLVASLWLVANVLLRLRS